MIEIVRYCQKNNREYYVFGHTSNSYFLPSFSPDVVISVLKLKGFTETAELITVECGMPTKTLAKFMVERGYIGFEGLIDLPGTVSGGIYGNAGCFGCLISDHLVSVRLLNFTGEIIEYSRDQLNFQNRTSTLKEGHIKGTILSASFNKIEGNKDQLKQKAQLNHENRLATQPEPVNNLGSVFKPDVLTPFGNWIRRIGKYSAKILRLKEDNHKILKLKLFLSGYIHLEKYLFDMNRFIWADKNAHMAFEEFLKLRKKLFKNNNFEIELFK